jgi:hypothetical protein
MRPVIHEINIFSQRGNVLRVCIEEASGGFTMRGDYSADGKTERSAVAFSGERVSNCEERFERCLKNLKDSLAKNDDVIDRVHNPCNTPFITAPQQALILQRLGINATVNVN